MLNTLRLTKETNNRVSLFWTLQWSYNHWQRKKFGTFLGKALTDRFLSGLLNEAMQEKFLNDNSKMKFKEAATTNETSKIEVKHFHGKINNGIVNKMSNNNNYVPK